jgi:hypothetical protein
VELTAMNSLGPLQVCSVAEFHHHTLQNGR